MCDLLIMLVVVFIFAAGIAWVAELPLLTAAAIAVGLFMMLDFLSEKIAQRYGITDPLPVSVSPSGLMQGIKLALMVLIVTGCYALLAAADIYLECGGAKLAFGSSMEGANRLAEFLAIFDLESSFAGIDMATCFGVLFAAANLIGSIAVVHFSFAALSSLASVLPNLPMRTDTDRKNLRAEFFNMLVPAVSLIVIISCFSYFFFAYSAPLATLFMARRLYSSDFEPPPSAGDTISGYATVKTIDLNAVMAAHQGEFTANILVSLPYALFAIHLLFAAVGDIGISYVGAHIGNYDRRFFGIVRESRYTLVSFLDGIVTQIVSFFHRSLPNTVRSSASRTRVPEGDSRQVALTDLPTPATEPALVVTEDSATEPGDLLDVPVRVIGAETIITPRLAQKSPDLYEVLFLDDPEGGYYLVKAKASDK